MEDNLIPKLRRQNLKIRIFVHAFNVERSHSYQLGVIPGGVSEVLDEVEVDSSDSFLDMRRKMEFVHDGLLTRRTSLFQEISMSCATAANPHGWASKVRRASYRLGMYSNGLDEDEVRKAKPVLIPCEDEKDTNVMDFMAEQGTNEVIVVPTAAIGPSCNKCCDGCVKCTNAKLSEEIVSFYLNGVFHTTNIKDIGKVKIDRELVQDSF